jgi:hypothetical protein
MLPLLAGAGRLLASGVGKRVAGAASKKAVGNAAKKISKDKFFNTEEKKKVDTVRMGMAKPPISPTKLLPPLDIKDPPKEVDLSKGTEDGGIKDTFNKIDDTLNGIISYLNSQNQFKKKESEDSRKRAELENKKRQENKLESKGKSNRILPSLKLPGDTFGIGKFFKNILIGGLILAIMNNLQSIIQFFKDTYNKIKEIIEKLGEFLSPIWDGLKWIAGEGIKLVAKMLGIPPENVDDKDILKNLNEIKDKIPFLKNLFEGINKTIASMGGTSTPSGQEGPPTTGGTQSGDLFEIIAGGEGGYESINRGNAGDSPGGAAVYFGKNLTDMTVGEVMSLQSQEKVFAVGKYQIIPETMIGFVQTMNISMDDKFDSTTQEKFKDYVVNIKRPEVGKYIRGESSNRAEAAQELAREFASVGLSYSEAGKVRGQSRYAGSAGNRASISPESIEAALDRARSGISVSSESAKIMTEGTYTVAGVTYSVDNGRPIQTPPPAAPLQAQVQGPAKSPAASLVTGISESADYEMPGGMSGAILMPIQSQGGSPTMSSGGGGGMIPVGISKKEVLNSLYQAQLVGFLYKQG